jgi:predicted  nucleic acid-binding Zn-ribbon protein
MTTTSINNVSNAQANAATQPVEELSLPK